MNPVLRTVTTRLAATLASLTAAAALITACGGGDDGPPPIPSETALAAACPDLTGDVVPPAEIGITSGAATVSTATLVPASDTVPAHCQVLGSIAPIDSAAQPIQFQLNMPLAWNEKALMYGGGGFNGSLVNALAPLRDAPAGQSLPIARGYTTFGTDSGHDGSLAPPTEVAQFALNDEMFENFAHASYKKVKDVAHRLSRTFYLRAPARQYFMGGSEGGREGLTMAQRYPRDFDGIIAVVPVINWTGLFHTFVNFTQPQFDGGALGTAKIETLANAVNAACDSLDGLADGVVNNWGACAAAFDPTTLLCAGGVDAGDTCLSNAQLAAVRAAYGPHTFTFPLANGITTYPARLYGGEIQPGGEGFGRWVSTGVVPSAPLPSADDARGVLYGNNFVRYVIARDPAFDIRSYDPNNFVARLQEVSDLMDSTDPDLTEFLRRGGKLIIRENSGDLAQSGAAGMRYYDAVVGRMTQPVVDRFVRLYVSPASSHGGRAASRLTGAEVPTMVDLLDPLDAWVTRGETPADVLVQVLNETAAPHATVASRPLCRYPDYPHFLAGDPLRAASYECRTTAAP